ncbi:MAG TPA: HEAT repeat domain-containing protein [Acidobacteriota bacterium]
MKHEEFRESLVLYLYDELNDMEKDSFAKHLKECPSCSAELEEIKRLQAALGSEPHETSEELLQDARRQLFSALRRETPYAPGNRNQAAVEPGSRWGGWLVGFFPYRGAFAAIATFAFGIFVGYLAFSLTSTGIYVAGTTPVDDPARGGAEIRNVRFVDPDARDGQVELEYEILRPVHIKGSIDDRRIQWLLSRALTGDENPGVRLGALNALAAAKPKNPDREIREALLSALHYDNNPGVRKEAIAALQRFPFDTEIKRAFLDVLMHEQNSGLRIAAIRGLQARTERDLSDQEVLKVLRDKVNSDENSYVRIQARSVLEEVTK